MYGMRKKRENIRSIEGCKDGRIRRKLRGGGKKKEIKLKNQDGGRRN